jgi:predicted phosphodiesterase
LADAQKKLEETAKQENQVKAELAAVTGNDDDDDDELFGDDDDDDDDKDKEVSLSLFAFSAWIYFIRNLTLLQCFRKRKKRKYALNHIY